MQRKSASLSASRVSEVQALGCSKSFTTSPITRKRKQALTSKELPPSKRRAKEKEPEIELPQTPETTVVTPTTIMDSDDEYLSGMSSIGDDFEGTQQSDAESLGEGWSITLYTFCKSLADSCLRR